MNCAGVNTVLHGFLWESFRSCKPGSGLGESQGKGIFSFSSLCQTVLQRGCANLHSQLYIRFSLLTSFPALGSRMDVKWHLILVWLCIPLTPAELVHLSTLPLFLSQGCEECSGMDDGTESCEPLIWAGRAQTSGLKWSHVSLHSTNDT